MSTVASRPAPRSRPRAVVALAAVLIGLGGVAACGESAPAAGPRVTDAALGPSAGAGPGYSYAPAAPEGAGVRVEVGPSAASTTVTLAVRGLQPDRGYAVHAHVRPCGPTGNDAGPHFQNATDPAATPERPSSDPAYANPTNEIWLDVQTDASGAGTASATVPWSTMPRAPQSVIIHEKMETATAPGVAGTAGGRLACVTAAFA